MTFITGDSRRKRLRFRRARPDCRQDTTMKVQEMSWRPSQRRITTTSRSESSGTLSSSRPPVSSSASGRKRQRTAATESEPRG